MPDAVLLFVFTSAAGGGGGVQEGRFRAIYMHMHTRLLARIELDFGHRAYDLLRATEPRMVPIGVY